MPEYFEFQRANRAREPEVLRNGVHQVDFDAVNIELTSR